MFEDQKEHFVVRGMITLDSSSVITSCDPVVAAILHLDMATVFSKSYRDAFQTLPQIGLIEALDSVYIQSHFHPISYLVDCDIPNRGPVALNFFVASRHDIQGVFIGTAVILDDYTVRDSRINMNRVVD